MKAQTMKTWKANIKLGNNGRQDVIVEAYTYQGARDMVQSMYSGCQIFGLCEYVSHKKSNSSAAPSFNYFNRGSSDEPFNIWLFLIFMGIVVFINYWYIVIPVALVLAVILAWNDNSV